MEVRLIKEKHKSGMCSMPDYSTAEECSGKCQEQISLFAATAQLRSVCGRL